MKKTRIFSLIALVLAMLMVFAACAPAATDTKSNDSPNPGGARDDHLLQLQLVWRQ